jgi:hypothetical protein
LRVSSANGVAPSNPPKARIVKIEPVMTALMPPLSGVCPVPNTLNVFALPAWKIRNTASTTNTATSKMPSTVPSRADVRMP